METYIVVTTIGVPKDLLYGYARHFNTCGHDNVTILIIGDLHTPEAENRELVNKLKREGVKTEYWDVSAQEEWLKRFPALKEFIPYNSDSRRNIGYLIAAERGAEVIITIDDDNYVKPDSDFIASHSIVGTKQVVKTVRSDNGWFNICCLLEVTPPVTIYPRGFPYSKRTESAVHWIGDTERRVVLNLGLWTGDPDVDAVTRLTLPVKSIGLKMDRVMLAQGTFSPINTQNTAFHRDILPCAYYIPMGASIQGAMLDRYGDIWFGLFAKKVIDHMNDGVTVGVPATIHRRNPHNLLRDLQNELWGMIATEYLVEALEAINLTATTYAAAYMELAKKLRDSVGSMSELPNGFREYFVNVTYGMEVWAEVSSKILGAQY